MGKLLIIKGADFSENAILTDKWYNSYEDLQGASNYSASVFAINPNEIAGLGLIGKSINAVRFHSLKADSTGVHIEHIKVTGNKSAGTVSYETIKDFGYHPTVLGINEFKLSEPIVFSEGESIRFSHISSSLTMTAKGTQDDIFTGFNNTSWIVSNYIKIMLGYKVGE